TLPPSTGSGAHPGSPSRRRRPESMAAGSCRFLFPPGGGEVNRERRSPPRRRVHQRQATVRIHGALHDGEAEAGAADSTRDERLEQAGPQVLRDARAVVAHGQGYGSLDARASRQLVRGGSSGAYYDAGALPRGLDGVQHQVRHHPVQQLPLARPSCSTDERMDASGFLISCARLDDSSATASSRSARRWSSSSRFESEMSVKIAVTRGSPAGSTSRVVVVTPIGKVRSGRRTV